MKIKQVGITGGIGAGKSFVAKLFEKIGIAVYDADKNAKLLMNSHPEIKSKIIELFGKEAYTNQELNRKFIAKQVFNNKNLLEKLNQIVHPRVFQHYEDWYGNLLKNNYEHRFCLKEAAILIESGSYKQMDNIILVYAPKILRLNRTMKRDNANKTEIFARMNKQISDLEKMQFADFVIYNDEKQSLLEQIFAFIQFQKI